MQKYQENLAANTSGALRPLSGASVTVTDSVTGLPASLYSDNGATPIAQPLTSDNDGYFSFYAADGKYLLTFAGARFATFTREIVLEDPLDNPYATLGQLSASTGANLVRNGTTLVSDALNGLTQSVADLEQAVEDLDTGTAYMLPTASSTVLGGIKLGANLTADAGGVVTAGLTNGAIVSALASSATVARTHTFQNKTGTVAHLDDIPAATAPGAMVLLAQASIGAVSFIEYLNIFTSGYASYRIDLLSVVGNFGQATTSLQMQMAVGGVLSGSPFSVSGQLNNSVGANVIFDLVNTNASTQKSLFYRTSQAGTTVYGGSAAGTGSAVSGFRISPVIGAFAAGGTILIYGYKAS
jgi:hypothetical protein